MPRKGKECRNCGKRNHFASVCRSAAKQTHEKDSAAQTINKLGSIQSVRLAVSRPAPTIAIEILDIKGNLITAATAIPDGGASVTVMGPDILHRLGENMNNLQHRGKGRLEAADGLPLETAGRLDLQLRYEGRSTRTPVVVCLQKDGMLISWFACLELGILHDSYPQPLRSAVNAITYSPRTSPTRHERQSTEG